MVSTGKVSRSGLLTDGPVAYWSESRPDEGGRQVVVAAGPDDQPVDVSPVGASVRTGMHEYGGGAMTVAEGILYYSDGADGRLYRVPVGVAAGRPLTPEPVAGEEVRFADFRLTPSGRWLLAVEERLAGGVTSHRLVAVTTDGSQRLVPLVSGPDFVTGPRVSPDGSRLAWVAWDHPAMPWDSSEVCVAELSEGDGGISAGAERKVAGGDGIAVGQPRWCRDGSLLFVDDCSGWWLPVRLGSDALVEGPVTGAMVEVEASSMLPIGPSASPAWPSCRTAPWWPAYAAEVGTSSSTSRRQPEPSAPCGS